ncbi:hypothetical protein V1511DRAFT_62714 [Dipodascopsis uninucleata]
MALDMQHLQWSRPRTWQLKRLENRPILVGSLLAACLYGSSELAASAIAWLMVARSTDQIGSRKIKLPKVNYRRILYLTSYGFLASGPSLYYLIRVVRGYAFMESRKPDRLRLILGGLLIAPIYSLIYLTAVSIYSGGRTVSEIISTIKIGFFPTSKMLALCFSSGLVTAGSTRLSQDVYAPICSLFMYAMELAAMTAAKRRRLLRGKDKD